MAFKEHTAVVDLTSGITNLLSRFQDIVFDAEHEAVYGMERFMSIEDCNKRAILYRYAGELCSLYLESDGKMSIDFFCRTLINCQLQGWLHVLKPYLPEELNSLLNEVMSNDDDTEDDADETSDDETHV